MPNCLALFVLFAWFTLLGLTRFGSGLAGMHDSLRWPTLRRFRGMRSFGRQGLWALCTGILVVAGRGGRLCPLCLPCDALCRDRGVRLLAGRNGAATLRRILSPCVHGAFGLRPLRISRMP